MENIIVMDIDQAEENQLAITPRLLRKVIEEIPKDASVVVFGGSLHSNPSLHWWKNIFKIDFNNETEKQPVLCFGSFDMGPAITFDELMKFVNENDLDESQRIIADCSNKTFHSGSEIVIVSYDKNKNRLEMWV